MSIKKINILESYADALVTIYFDVDGQKKCRTGNLKLTKSEQVISHVSVRGKESCGILPLRGSNNTSIICITDDNNEIIYPTKKKTN